ncbi:chorismate-binding protein [Corynebacterium mastitidis]|uniref:aminodeoxychorismate synthase n=1 Tax=Corynebacterium mastitidis TaxID=161890 RepID=A0ABU8NZN9_9CORY
MTTHIQVLVVDNYDSYTNNIADLITQISGTVPVILQRADLNRSHWDMDSGITHVVLAPGPGHPSTEHDMAAVNELIDEITIPLLGICFGHQAIALRFGADVEQIEPHHGSVEACYHSDHDLFVDIPSPFDVVRYHSLSMVEGSDLVEPIAWDSAGEVLALQVHGRNITGVQFHPESVLTSHGEQLLRNFLGIRTEENSGAWTPIEEPERSAWYLPTEVAIEPLSIRASDTLSPEKWDIAWLDSADRRSWTGQYSYFAIADRQHAPTIEWSAWRETERIRLNGQPAQTASKADVAAVLADAHTLARSSRIDAIPSPFQGGWIGAIGYEASEDTRRHDANDINMAITYFDTVLVVDHVAGNSWLILGKDKCTNDRLMALVRETVATSGSQERGKGKVPKPTPRDADQLTIQHIDEQIYQGMFNHVQEFLHQGDAYEVNLTHKIRVNLENVDVDLARLYSSLRASNPAPYSAMIRIGDVQLLSSSPEQFLRFDANRYMSTRPIKGTMPRSTTPQEDASNSAQLASDPRFIAENLMVADLLRHDLAGISVPGTRATPELLSVESYSSVHQLVTAVTGRARDDISAASAISAILPGGSMTAPQSDASQKSSVQWRKALEGGILEYSGGSLRKRAKPLSSSGPSS